MKRIDFTQQSPSPTTPSKFPLRAIKTPHNHHDLRKLTLQLKKLTLNQDPVVTRLVDKLANAAEERASDSIIHQEWASELERALIARNKVRNAGQTS